MRGSANPRQGSPLTSGGSTDGYVPCIQSRAAYEPSSPEYPYPRNGKAASVYPSASTQLVADEISPANPGHSLSRRSSGRHSFLGQSSDRGGLLARGKQGPTAGVFNPRLDEQHLGERRAERKEMQSHMDQHQLAAQLNNMGIYRPMVLPPSILQTSKRAACIVARGSCPAAHGFASYGFAESVYLDGPHARPVWWRARP
jgi:hypothetical protein